MPFSLKQYHQDRHHNNSHHKARVNLSWLVGVCFQTGKADDAAKDDACVDFYHEVDPEVKGEPEDKSGTTADRDHVKAYLPGKGDDQRQDGQQRGSQHIVAEDGGDVNPFQKEIGDIIKHGDRQDREYPVLFGVHKDGGDDSQPEEHPGEKERENHGG